MYLTEALFDNTFSKDTQLDLPRYYYNRQRSQSESLQVLSDSLNILAKAQIAFGALGFVISIAFIAGPVELAFQVYLLGRLLTLFLVGVGTHHLFQTRTDPWNISPTLTFVSLYLQLLWFFAEILLGVSPPLIVIAYASHLLASAPYIGAALISPLPACAMVSLAGVKSYIARLRRRRNSETLQSSPGSPIDSVSSRSSNGVFSGNSSPTGHCASPDRRGPHHRTDGKLDDDVVFMEHILDTNESVLFVHKNLSPIKTRPGPPPIFANTKGSYIPLLAPLMASGGLRAKHGPTIGPAMPMATVNATVTIVGGGKSKPLNIPQHDLNPRPLPLL